MRLVKPFVWYYDPIGIDLYNNKGRYRMFIGPWQLFVYEEGPWALQYGFKVIARGNAKSICRGKVDVLRVFIGAFLLGKKSLNSRDRIGT